jgi:D-alanine-D-alanine ligase-like ATP-grasp enzyme
VVREAWRLDPLAWIHRAEARAIARELRAGMATYPEIPRGRPLLRLSDAAMRAAVRTIGVAYAGPGSAALERCYDKYEATRTVAAAGLETPQTYLASAAPGLRAPFVLKPRRGSDSIGVRIVAAIPARKRNDDYVAQERVIGDEVTVAIFRDRVGMPLRIHLPPGTPYSFLRKYLLRPARSRLDDRRLAEAAVRIGKALGVDWAARVDFIVVAGGGRRCFLECDAAPLVGPDSAFAASFAAAGVDRATQLGWLCR